MEEKRVFAVPTYIIIMSIVAIILDLLGVILLLMQTFDDDFYY
jgi:hypothetical protein